MNTPEQADAPLADALCERHENIQAILTAAQESIFLFDPDGTTLYANETAAARLGRTVTEVIGRHCSAYMPPEVVPSRLARLREVCTTGRPVRFEDTRDGLIFDHYLYPVVTQGRVTRIASFSRDITERKQAEAMRTRYQLISQHARDALLLIDLEGRIREGNQAAVEFYGYPYDALRQLSITDLRPQDAPELVRAQLAAARAHGVLFEALHRRQDGTLVPVEVNSHGVTVDGEELLLSVVRDISERKRAEEALRLSEERYRSLFNGMTEGFALHEIICDAAGVPRDYRFLDINPAFERLTGLRRDGVLGNTHHQVLPDDDPRWLEVYGAVALTGTPTQFENYSPALRRHFEVFAYRPAPGQFAVIFKDITARKRDEEAQVRLHRTLAAHTRSSRAMMHATDAATYMRDVCTIIAEDCGHALVWIGLADTGPGKTVRPAASAGFEEGYLDTLQVTWADTPRGGGPTGTAIRTGQPYVCRDMLVDPQFAPWREAAARRGYASSVALPLTADGTTFGALTIYAREPDAFSEDEVRLLRQLADDLAYGLYALRLRTALRDSEERFRVALQNSPISVATLDRQLRYTWVYNTRHGFAPEQVLGKRADELLPPADAAETIALQQRVLERGVGERAETHGVTHGVPWVYDAVAEPVRDAAGAVVGLTFAAMDITERKEAERERERLMQESARHAAELEATLAAIADGVIVYGRDGEILRMNPAAARWAREAPEAFALQGGHAETTSLEHPDGTPYRLAETPAWRALVEGVTTIGAQVALTLPAQCYRLAISAAQIRTAEGRTLGAIITLTDITPLHELQERQRLLLHMVSHDLRAPLTIIDGHATLLREFFAEQDARPPQRMADTLLRAVKRINVMIEDLVDAARVEGGQLRLTLRPVALSAYLPEMLARNALVLATERIRLAIPADLPPVPVDEARLERILMNLLANAQNYSPPEQPIDVRLRREADRVVVSVIDRGSGIDPDDLPHLFDQFFRGNGRHQVKGIGLGLYITRLIVEAHGGRIWAESTPGEGSTFSFTMPLA